jgi:hypothetical protein
MALPPLKQLGLLTLHNYPGQPVQPPDAPAPPLPGEGSHRWLTGQEITSAASSASRPTLSRETPGLRGHPRGGRIPTQSRGHTRGGVAFIDPRRLEIRRDETDSSSDDSSTEDGDEMDVDR